LTSARRREPFRSGPGVSSVSSIVFDDHLAAFETSLSTANTSSGKRAIVTVMVVDADTRCRPSVASIHYIITAR
jgi:hypothetical protein